MSEKTTTTTIDHVLKYTGVFGGVQGLSVLMSVVRTKLATKLLGPAGIGLMGIYISIADFVGSTSNFGIPFSSVRRLSELFGSDDAEAQRRFVCVVRTWCLWTALLAALVCVACSPLLCRAFFDGDEGSRWHPVLIAPMVMANLVTAGELSILKGMRRLKRVALISLLSAFALLCVTIPVFWAWRTDGILLALDATAVVTLAIHLSFTLPIYPWRVDLLSRDVFREGWQMVRIGVPYVLAAIAGNGVIMAIPALILNYGSIEEVGFYRAATSLMVGYASIVFTALESDFFPRLSSVNHNRCRRNTCINQQIQVCVALVGPFMIALAVMMPVVLHILYASEFMVIEEMALAAVFYTFLRAVSTPIGYTALAHGDSVTYLTLEVIYDLVSLGLIIGGYRLYGLVGAGVGLSASALFDVALLGVCYSFRYGFRFERHTLAIIAAQTALVAAAVAICLVLPPAAKYAAGALVLAVSLWTAVASLGRDSEVIARICRKLHLKRLIRNSAS